MHASRVGGGGSEGDSGGGKESEEGPGEMITIIAAVTVTVLFSIPDQTDLMTRIYSPQSDRSQTDHLMTFSTAHFSGHTITHLRTEHGGIKCGWC